MIGGVVTPNPAGGNPISDFRADDNAAETSNILYVGGVVASGSIYAPTSIQFVTGFATSTLGGVEVGVFNNIGQFGVNTTTPTAMLSVQSTTTVDSLNIASSSGVSQLIVKSNGFVGIGTSTPAGNLSASGTVFMAGLTTAASSAETGYLCLNGQNQVINDSLLCVSVSAARYKNNIKPLTTLGLNQVMQLHPKSFYFDQGQGDNGQNLQ